MRGVEVIRVCAPALKAQFCEIHDRPNTITAMPKKLITRETIDEIAHPRLLLITVPRG